jgi:hypothetical protein
MPLSLLYPNVMSKRSRRTITLVITESWTIRWGNETMTPTATPTQPSQRTYLMNKKNHMTAFENATKFFIACEAPAG